MSILNRHSGSDRSVSLKTFLNLEGNVAQGMTRLALTCLLSVLWLSEPLTPSVSLPGHGIPFYSKNA